MDIIMGAILMLTGLAVHKFPMMIAGLNTMSDKRLAQVNVEALKRGVRNALLIGSGVILILGAISTWVYLPMGVHITVQLVTIFGIVVASSCIARKYDTGMQGEEGKKERKKNRIGIIITLVIFTAVLIFFFQGGKPATIEVSEEYITARGCGYSASIPLTDITAVTVLSDRPDISIRTNGLSTDKVNIGHFRLKNGERCMLFLCNDGGPVLEVRTADEKLYYLNCGTEFETLEMIAQVKNRHLRSF